METETALNGDYLLHNDHDNNIAHYQQSGDEIIHDKDFNDNDLINVSLNGHSMCLQRSMSEATFQLDWEKLDKKFSKFGRNGHRTIPKEFTEQLKQIPISGLEFVTEPLRDKQENQTGNLILTSDTFAGRRDVSDPSSVQEKEIVSRRGTVRGFKNRVRAGIATFLSHQDGEKNYREIERGKIIVYTTTMTIMRKTCERCMIVRKILQNHMVRYEEKDLFMNKEFQKELKQRLNSNVPTLPQVFADGMRLGTAEDLERLNESGELRYILRGFKKIRMRSNCDKCGGYRFVPCTSCHGSKKSLHRNNFTEEFCALRCMQCNENGLLRCDMCLDQQE
ncbi:hypothetical protein KUTeg_024535 [Tegillarca granosa]|uniref:Glutaredoxin domain-containing protein n=1 Tax=Tegillarca granosa TaxID=220873 RepID=A0ABQ9E1L5_TEGGR|nr:hypothetical protein KUTeg_024535 [Tegillarca granosa]